MVGCSNFCLNRMPVTAVLRAALIIILAVLLPLSTGCAGSGPARAAAAETGWVCPPCSSRCHDEIYDEAGNCPVCGMELVKSVDGVVEDGRMKAAILLFDGVQIIDYTGPYEVFGQAGFNVYTVSETGETITTAMDMSVNPHYSFLNSPEPDILLVPGGDVKGQYENPTVIDWVRRASRGADYTLSVCNGAFIIAKAGLLDGRKATTFYGLIDEFKKFAPKVEVVRDQRYVDNGDVLTSAGLSSGIDASIYLVSKIHGYGRAQQLALHLEYDWNPDSEFARAAFPDRHLPSITPPEGAELMLTGTTGGRDHWERVYDVKGSLSAGDLREYIDAQMSELDDWTRGDTPGAGDDWRFVDEDGGIWTGRIRVEKNAETDGLRVRFAIQRGSRG